MIPFTHLLIGFLPVLGVIVVMHRWRLQARDALLANLRMLVQLLVVGYVLTYVFHTDRAWVVLVVLAVMLAASTWIAMRPLDGVTPRGYLIAGVAIGGIGTAVLVLVTQLVLELSSWHEPRVVVPLAGMVYANAMNTVSLAAERLEAELARGAAFRAARRAAMDAAMIPQINALLAVGLVSLPGMMTGQILAGIDPLLAVRYQIMVMCMIFGAAGLATAVYLQLRSAR